MPSRLELVKTPAASIPNGNPGEVNGFIDDADGLFKTKDEGGAVSNQSGSSADEINNASANPVITNAGPEPASTGLVMATTVIGPPHQGEFVDPRVNGISSSLLIKNPKNDSGPVAATIDELVLCDPGSGGGSNDITVNLPTVGASQLNRLIAVKVVSTVDGFKVSVAGAVSGNIDGLANGDPDLDLTTDRQWMILIGTGTGWLIIG